VSQHWHAYSCKSPSCSTVQPFSGSTALFSDLLSCSILSSVFHLSSHRTASLELPQTRNSDCTMFIDPSNSWITLSNLAFSLIISNHPQITFLCVCKLSSHISLCCKLALAAALMTWGIAEHHSWRGAFSRSVQDSGTVVGFCVRVNPGSAWLHAQCQSFQALPSDI
jgi:hypothetical protein